MIEFVDGVAKTVMMNCGVCSAKESIKMEDVELGITAIRDFITEENVRILYTESFCEENPNYEGFYVHLYNLADKQEDFWEDDIFIKDDEIDGLDIDEIAEIVYDKCIDTYKRFV